MELLQTAPYLSQHTSAIVEGGHLYADEELTDDHYISTQIALKVAATLEDMGLSTTLCTLIDDFNAPDTSSDINMQQLESTGFNPSVIFREKDYQDVACDMLALLISLNKAKVRKTTGDWHLKDDSFVKLMSANGKPTCALLDAALYCHKHTTFGGICVTVLPDTHAYRAQQHHTKAILKATERVIPILNVYFTSSNSFSLDFDY